MWRTSRTSAGSSIVCWRRRLSTEARSAKADLYVVARSVKPDERERLGDGRRTRADSQADGGGGNEARIQAAARADSQRIYRRAQHHGEAAASRGVGARLDAQAVPRS